MVLNDLHQFILCNCIKCRNVFLAGLTSAAKLVATRWKQHQLLTQQRWLPTFYDVTCFICPQFECRDLRKTQSYFGLWRILNLYCIMSHPSHFLLSGHLSFSFFLLLSSCLIFYLLYVMFTYKH